MGYQQTIFGLGKQANHGPEIFCVPGDNCQKWRYFRLSQHCVCACGGGGMGEALLPGPRKC